MDVIIPPPRPLVGRSGTGQQQKRDSDYVQVQSLAKKPTTAQGPESESVEGGAAAAPQRDDATNMSTAPKVDLSAIQQSVAQDTIDQPAHPVTQTGIENKAQIILQSNTPQNAELEPPLLSVAPGNDVQDLRREDFVTPRGGAPQDSSSYYYTTSDTDMEARRSLSAFRSRGAVVVPKRHASGAPTAARRPLVGPPAAGNRGANRFVFGLFASNQVRALRLGHETSSFLADAAIEHSLYHTLSSNRFLARTIYSRQYYKSGLNKRVWPDLAQCGSFTLRIGEQLVADFRNRYKSNMIVQMQVCSLCIRGGETVVEKLSNVAQMVHDKAVAQRFYFKADLVRSPAAFLLVELSGYDSFQVMRNYAWGCIRINNGLNYAAEFDANCPVCGALDRQDSLMDDHRPFAQLGWISQAYVLGQIGQNKKVYQLAFLSRSQRIAVGLYSKNCCFYGVGSVQKLQHVLELEARHISEKELQRLNRLPTYFICTRENIRVLDHAGAVLAVNYKECIETFQVVGEGDTPAPGEARKEVCNRALDREANTLAIILNSYRFSANQRFSRTDDHLSVLCRVFNWVYRRKERSRRERMKNTIKIMRVEDRVFIEDFIRLLGTWEAVSRSYTGRQEIWGELRRLYKCR